MENKKVVRVEFYQSDSLPEGLAKIAKAQKFESKGIIAVKTLISSPPSYEFEPVGDSVENIAQYMQKVASKEGVDLNTIIKKVFTEEAK